MATVETPLAVEIRCTGCGKTQATKRASKGLRVPKGWKRREEASYCPACWLARFRLRAITFPVAEVINGTWEEFQAALKDAWGRTTALANWAVTALAQADVIRKAGDAKMLPMPTVNLYALWQQHHQRQEWTGAAQSANAVLHSVEQKYRKQRYDVIWQGTAVLPRHRYPVPYPVHNQAWKAGYDEHIGMDGHVSRVPTVSIPVGTRRWRLRLLGGKQRRRQLAAFSQIASGMAIQGELSLYRVRSSAADHRGGRLEDRDPGGGRRISYRTMCKLVAWLPRSQEARKANHTMLLKTDPNALWVAEIEGQAPWVCNRDDAPRRIEEHRVYRQRMSEDLKPEKRWPAKVRRRMVESLHARCAKHNRWLDSFCHEMTAGVAAYAQRRAVAEVIYDDLVRSYLPSFPWHKIKKFLRYKLDDLGIQLACANDEESAIVQ